LEELLTKYRDITVNRISPDEELSPLGQELAETVWCPKLKDFRLRWKP
jgi:hypothetical protein